MAVLPHDLLRPRVDHDHAVAVVVVRRRSARSASARRATACSGSSARTRRRTTTSPGCPRVISTILPGTVNDDDEDVPVRAAAARPTGTRPASAPTRRAGRSRSSRSIQPPISVTSRPPSGAACLRSGLANPYGGLCVQLPPRTRLPSPSGVSWTIRQLRMSATVVVPVRQPVGVVRRVQVAGARPGHDAWPYRPDRRLSLRRPTSLSVSLNSSFVITERSRA